MGFFFSDILLLKTFRYKETYETATSENVEYSITKWLLWIAMATNSFYAPYININSHKVSASYSKAFQHSGQKIYIGGEGIIAPYVK